MHPEDVIACFRIGNPCVDIGEDSDAGIFKADSILYSIAYRSVLAISEAVDEIPYFVLSLCTRIL